MFINILFWDEEQRDVNVYPGSSGAYKPFYNVFWWDDDPSGSPPPPPKLNFNNVTFVVGEDIELVFVV